MADQDLVITVADTADLTVTLIQDTIALVEIEPVPAEIAVDTVVLEGRQGEQGPEGGQGERGPPGPMGPPGAEPDLPDFSLLFENQLI